MAYKIKLITRRIQGKILSIETLVAFWTKRENSLAKFTSTERYT